jgi:hypothetical protein
LTWYLGGGAEADPGRLSEMAMTLKARRLSLQAPDDLTVFERRLKRLRLWKRWRKPAVGSFVDCAATPAAIAFHLRTAS